MSKGKKITQKEVDYVKVNVMIKPISEIAEDLGRNYYTIYNIAKKIGVNRNHNFTMQEDAFISRNYKSMRIPAIAFKLNITPEMVYNRARKLGLKKNASRIKE